jgi:serine/threonine protein kinase
VKEVIKKNCECDLNFDNENFKTLPTDARDLFQRMLARDPLQRITARDALSHPYLSSQKLAVYTEELEAQNIYQT